MSYSYDPEDPGPLRGEGDEDDEMFTRRERHEAPRANLVSEFVRKAIENTVGQARSTGTLSKEALAYLLQQGDRGKREVLRIVAKEVGEFLRHVDLSSEVIKVLTSVQVDFQASVRFRRTPEGEIKPELSPDSSVSVTESESAPDRQTSDDEASAPDSSSASPRSGPRTP